MKLLATLDRRDRRLLGITAAVVLCTIVLLVLVHPQEEQDTGVPSTYATAPHGAKAAFLLLQRLGYRVERSEAPLPTIAEAAGPQTVLILAQPTRTANSKETAAVRQVLARGGRVLGAGYLAAALLPENSLNRDNPLKLVGAICEADPVGFSPLAAGGKFVMREVSYAWKTDQPHQQAVYTCAGEAVVVTYPVDRGTVVWWASASPLENQDIASNGSLDLLFNSLHLVHSDRIVWDESLHAEPVAAWDASKDRIVLALVAQLLLVALLLVLARGRRSGPLRPLPAPARSSPMEFVRSLGGLYRASGANDVPVTIAYERFRATLAQRHGIAQAQTADAATLAAMLERRFGLTAATLHSDLEACENAGRLSNLSTRQALSLVQALARYSDAVAHQAERSHSADHRGTLGTEHTAQPAGSRHRTRLRQAAQEATQETMQTRPLTPSSGTALNSPAGRLRHSALQPRHSCWLTGALRSAKSSPGRRS